MAKIKIIYGSTSGNTELVSDKVAQVLGAAGHVVTTQRVERSSSEDIAGNDLTILASSTYGHGVLQEHFEQHGQRLLGGDLTGQRFAVIGLGDPKYDSEYNIESAAILEKMVLDHGGELVCDSLRVNRNPIPKLAKNVTAWATALATTLGGN